jgi:hypothetical protein
MTTRQQAIFVAAAFAAVVPGNVTAQIIVTPNIEEVCRSAPSLTSRKTLVYVDVAALVKGKTDWGVTILNKLELTPRERLTVLGVNPSSFEISEVFDTCYPSWTKGEIETLRTNRGTWDKLFQLDPQDQQRENLQTFDARLRNSLDKLLTEGGKFTSSKRRNVLGAIAFDKNRFADQSAFYRVIIYTDATILDPALDPSAPESQQVTVLKEKYPASLAGAEISIFGVAGGEGKDAPESKERVFSAFFLNNWSHLISFSSSLPQQRSDLYPPIQRFEGIFEGGGTQGSVKLSLATTKGGILTEGWLAFLTGRNPLYVPFQGEHRCEGDVCKLTAATTESIPALSSAPYFRKGDRILLQGRGSRFEGTLQAEAREVFKEGTQKEGTQEVRYSLKFAKP